MKILMLSTDRGLLGNGQLGDVVDRHREYGKNVESLDIIVLSRSGESEYPISENVISHSTKSMSKLLYFFDAVKIGKKLTKKKKFDLIIAQDPFITGFAALQLKKNTNAKFLLHFHGDFWNNKQWLSENKINIFLNLLAKYITPRADAIRVMSTLQKEKLVGSGISEKKVRIISTPIDVIKYQKNEIIFEENIVLHVGRDDKVKDYETLVKSFIKVKRKIPDVIFWQAGANNKIKKAMKANSSPHIFLKGAASSDELIEIYKRSSIVVLSSTSESFGKVLVEANAAGKPVVSTSTSGGKEIVQDGYNGFLVPIGDSSALAEKIIYLLEHPDIAKKMGEQGRALVTEKYSNNLQKIIQYWRDIVEEKI